MNGVAALIEYDRLRCGYLAIISTIAGRADVMYAFEVIYQTQGRVCHQISKD